MIFNKKGGIILTDSKKLNEIISESGITITAIASKLGITREGLYKKRDELQERGRIQQLLY